MFDHITINVADYEKSIEFYKRALEPLGYSVLMGDEDYSGFGSDRPRFWVSRSDDERPKSQRAHIAFLVDDRATVEAFYNAALAAGGTDNGAPGIREQYSPDYYGAFVIDLDGNNIEAVTYNE